MLHPWRVYYNCFGIRFRSVIFNSIPADSNVQKRLGLIALDRGNGDTISLFHDGHGGKLFTGIISFNPPSNPVLQKLLFFILLME